MLNPGCIICCKLGCDDPDYSRSPIQDASGDDDDDVKFIEEVKPSSSSQQAKDKLWTLDQFFIFLGRYLDNSHLAGGGGGGQSQETNWLLLEKVMDVIDAKKDGEICCDDCSKIVDTFCELYDQLKSIELRINHQVQRLEEVMIPSGKKRKMDFESGVEFLEGDDESCDAVLNFKRDLLKRCRQKLQSSPPSLELVDIAIAKVKSEEDDDEPMLPSKFSQDEVEDSPSPSPSGAGVNDDPLDDDDYAPSPSSDSDDANSEDDKTATSDRDPLDTSNFKEREEPAPVTVEMTGTEAPVRGRPKPGAQVARSTYNPESGKHKCNFCHKEFVNRCSVSAHYRHAHTNRPFKPTLKCGTCGEQFTLRSQYNRHRKIFHPSGSAFKCNVCGEAFKFKRLLKRHQRNPCKNCKQEEGEDEVPSAGATAISTQPQTDAIPVADPQSSINPLTGNFQCSKCPREFTSNGALQEHWDVEHLNQRFTCPPCNKSFKCRFSLLRHQRIDHKGIRLQCPKCGKSLTGAPSLRLHLHTCGTGMVTVSPRQKCSVCEKDIACTSLRSHMKHVHLNVRDQVCSECGKAFVTKGELQAHVNCVHLQLREHLCDICGKRFKNNVNLRIHRQKIHGVTV